MDVLDIVDSLLQQPVREVQPPPPPRLIETLAAHPHMWPFDEAVASMAEESMLLIRAEPEIITNDLIDALMEAVVLPLDARARSAAIRCLMEEITMALEWLAGQDSPGDDATAAELVSLRQLTTAAHDHERRMMTLTAPAATGGRWTPGRRGAGGWVPASNRGVSLLRGLP